MKIRDIIKSIEAGAGVSIASAGVTVNSSIQ